MLRRAEPGHVTHNLRSISAARTRLYSAGPRYGGTSDLAP